MIKRRGKSDLGDGPADSGSKYGDISQAEQLIDDIRGPRDDPNVLGAHR